MEQIVNKKNTPDGSIILEISLRIDRTKLCSNMPFKIEIDISSENDAGNDTSKELSKDFMEYAERYQKKDKRMVKSCSKWLERFMEVRNVYTDTLSPSICSDFYDYLCDELHGITPSNYFKKFRQYLDRMVDEGRIACNPAKKVKLHFWDYRQKSIITEDEIRQICEAKTEHEDIKEAFLFSCFTGLRWCDIVHLCHDNINSADHSLSITQQKVARHSSMSELHTYLNDTAYAIIEKRCYSHTNGSGLIFTLPAYSTMYKSLKSLMEDAGIEKHITFHCARHTFISRLVEKGVDIKTVAILAGHSSTRHTERYMHIQARHLYESMKLLEM